MGTEPGDEFAEWASARWLPLVRAAVSLGCGQQEAEDLTQVTLMKAYASWSRVSRADNRDAYVSKILVHAHRDSHRRRWRGETPTAELPEGIVEDDTAAYAAADVLRRALVHLTPGQREVIALRYFLQLTESEIAATLRIAPGTVKSRLSRGLAQLQPDHDLADLRDGGSHA